VAQFSQLLELARPDQGGWVKVIQALPRLARDLQASRVRQLSQLDQRILDIPTISLALELGCHEQSPLSRDFCSS
jgi:hypothetical protein